ncbi:endolytic transglycosylase MltG [Candidatus Saccharibacteria bacterium]|nr:endolytic transglycosylase MltG [Candidatus Saccharibacteria bacterium]
MRNVHFRPIRRIWLIIAILLVLFVGAGLAARGWYNRNLAAVSSSQQTTYFPVANGSTLHDIATDLKRAGLIRSTTAFEAYVRGRQLYAKMQAGTYALTPSMSTPQIVDKIVKGEVSKSYVTILPGKTVKQIRQTFKQAGYGDAELDGAFNPSTYPDEPVLDNLPPGASLEGFLYPDTFQMDPSTPAQTIIRESLEEMQAHLTPDIVNGFKAQGLSVFQGVTLASIVYQESGDPSAEPTVAQVFLSRLKQGIMLGSDVTAFYAANLVGAGQTLGVDSPYNTRIHSGMPPGPIGNMTDDALKAVAHPATTDYLFFVAGDDGRIHFSHTEAEHEQAVKQYCTKQCS